MVQIGATLTHKFIFFVVFFVRTMTLHRSRKKLRQLARHNEDDRSKYGANSDQAEERSHLTFDANTSNQIQAGIWDVGR